MTSRERMAAILAGEAPDRVALYEHFWGDTFPVWKTQGFPEGTSPDTLFGFDLQPLGWSVDTTPFRDRPAEIIEEDDERKLVRDGRGATLRYWKHKSGTPEHVAFECTSPEVWKTYRERLLDLDLTRIDREHLPKGLAAAKEGSKFCVYGNLFVFELLRGILGDVCMLESFLLEPEWIHDFCRVYTDFFKRHYDWVFSNIGLPDGMFIYEDLGFKNGPFCSPTTYREVIQPYHTELVDFFHSYGLPVILHSCGNATRLFDQLCETGWNCLQPMEAKAGNDVLALADRAKELGAKIGFMGNIDVTVWNTNDEAQIRAEVERKVGGMVQRGAGYCFHSDHSVPPDVSYPSYKFAVELMRELGVYQTAVV